MKSFIVNKYLLFIATIIFFNLQCFYLVDTSIVPTGDIAVLLEVGFMVYVFYKCRITEKRKYTWIFILPLFLVLTSSYMAYLSYGQPLLLGIRAQRHWIMAMLMYFPLSRLFKSGRLKIEQVFDLLSKLNFIFICLILAQYFLGNNLLFMHVQNNIRYGSIRLYISMYFVLMSYYFHLKNVLDGNKIRFIDFFMIAATLFIELFVIKSRMNLTIIFAVTLIAILSHKTTWRKLALIGVALFAGCAFMVSGIGQVVLESMFGQTAQDAGTAIREVGRVFYIEQTMSSPLSALFGSGYANLDWRPTVTGIRYLEGIYYNDNGIFGLFFYYGFAFITWMIISHIRLLKDARRSGRRDCFFFLLCGLFGIYTLFPYSYVTNISFALVCAIIEQSWSDKFEKQKEESI
ncbi:hypothetical protein QFZ31_004488 [Neobacillus niacini]|uniref:hypothetical protein n=1 Tax=Neobacillus driksii TaxID=3035913 RepID=UPI00278B3CDF|nr:hypothetical protein [Neobacillus niacini]MDQ0974610.1 hypothetical protein [Neobacillus niacini]